VAQGGSAPHRAARGRPARRRYGPIISPGNFTVALGQGSILANQCTVNLTGAVPGTYSGTITLTVTVL